MDSSHVHVKKNTGIIAIGLEKAICTNPQCESYLGDVDASLLERAVVGVLRAHVAVLAPVAWERAVYTGEAAETERDERRRLGS